MKRILLPLAALAVSSCIIDPLYIQMPQTYWSYSVETQTARVCFPDDTHASVLQLITDGQQAGTIQAQHGTYTTDGHRVILTGEEWSNNIQFVRTFSHLKNNSTNRNMTPLKPQSHQSLAGSIWCSMVNNNLEVSRFLDDGTCIQASFNNVTHEEGIPYGWKWGKQNYTLSGNRLDADSMHATLFEDFMVVDTLAILIAKEPSEEDNASNALAGTYWTSGGMSTYPGLLIFTGNDTFTRIQVASKFIYQVKHGTYAYNGSSISFCLDGKEETCPLDGNRFTFFEVQYTKDTTLDPPLY